MNKKTLFVLGTFWIFVVALVSAGSVAAEGMYWGDSIDDTDSSVTVEEPVYDEPVLINTSWNSGNNFITCGMYWGD